MPKAQTAPESMGKKRTESQQREAIFEVRESPEGRLEARALGHSIFTEADTLEELKVMVRDAVRCHFDADTAPQLIRLHLKDQVIPA